jgi:cytochrome c
MRFSWLEKIGFGLLIAAWVAFGSNMIGNSLVQAEKLETSAYQVLGGDEAEKPETAAASEMADNALTLLASADAGKGVKVFKKCKACHSAEEGGKNKVGPNLWDVVGRAKGSSAGFKYSDPLVNMGGKWSYEDLDGFLTNPKGFLKGTKMSFAGVKKAGDRAAVILYLRSLSASPKALP